jgi:hypothetical protein
MDVSDKYTHEKEANPKKILLSNDAFAICEFLDLLIKKIERARMSLK